MYTILVLGGLSFLLCLLLTPLCRNAAIRLGLVDLPDDRRKLHARPIPAIGGVPIVLSYAAALALVFFFSPSGARLYIRHHELLLSLLPAAAVIFFTGVLDDVMELRPWQKLCGQFVGASLAVGLGTRIARDDFSLSAHHSLLASPWVNVPLSIVWLIGCSNAVNLIDGMDGLAAGVSLLATITTLVAGLLSHNIGLVIATVPLAGCLLGFLRYNFSPASIFLGDSGSLTIGFMLGCFGLVWGQRHGTMLGMAAPMMALALPLIDVGLAICRRFLRSVPIFEGDRGHIHHMMLARGLKPRDTALILYGVCAIAASLALMQSFSGLYLHIPVIIVFVALAWLGVRSLNYIEFGAARRVFSGRHIIRTVREEIFLHDLDRALAQAATLEGSWQVVCSTCADLRVAAVQMFFRGEAFEKVLIRGDGEKLWKITVPLGKTGSLTLSRIGDGAPPSLMLPVVDRIQESLSRRELVAEDVYASLSDVA